MKNQKSDANYTMGRSQEETERLIEQAQLYGKLTQRFLVEAGITNGMKVLDIGSGAGDVALILAELVGTEGEVLGVDVNAEILETARTRTEEAGYTNVTFIAGDARTLELDTDFDAVVGRLVLMYMVDPTDALKRLATRLRPEGIVAFQETDFTPYQAFIHPDTPLINQLIEWGANVFQRSGAHTSMGMDLYKAFVDAGLPEPTLHFAAPGGNPETGAAYHYIARSFQSFLPLLEKFEIATAAEVDVETLAERLQQEVVNAKRPFFLPPWISAYAKKIQ